MPPFVFIGKWCIFAAPLAVNDLYLLVMAKAQISIYCCLPLRAQGQTFCLSCSLQIVAQKKMVKPLLLKYGKYAGKSTITVGS